MLESTEQEQLCQKRFTGQVCTQMLHISCAHLNRVLHQKRLGTENFSAIPIQPFTSWAMDLIGLMPRSKDGNERIMICVDRTPKTIVVATAAHKHTSAEDLAKLTFKETC